MKKESDLKIALKSFGWAILIVLLLIFLIRTIVQEMQAQSRAAYMVKAVAPNKDDLYLDSCFRWLEKMPSGGTTRIRAKEYTLTRDVILPQMINKTTRKKFIIDMNGAKIFKYGFKDTATTWERIHNVNTFRSFIIRNGEFNGSDVGLFVQGCQMNIFENLVFAGCRTGAKFGLCLQTKMDLIEENQNVDTGVYIGCAVGIGCDASNSQSNNVTLTTFRSFGAGNAIALIADRVSGARWTNLTNEGAGAKYFLYVNGQNSNWMKSFIAQDIHIECENRIACIYSYVDGYANFKFSNIFAQHGNLLIDGYGTGINVIDNINYMPNIAADKYPNLAFRNHGTGIWWQFVDCIRYGGKPYTNNFYWVTGNGATVPTPSTPGQLNCNYGAARCFEIVNVKE